MLHAVRFTREGVTYAIKNLESTDKIRFMILNAKDGGPEVLKAYIMMQSVRSESVIPSLKVVDWKDCHHGLFNSLYGIWIK